MIMQHLVRITTQSNILPPLRQIGCMYFKHYLPSKRLFPVRITESCSIYHTNRVLQPETDLTPWCINNQHWVFLQLRGIDTSHTWYDCTLLPTNGHFYKNNPIFESATSHTFPIPKPLLSFPKIFKMKVKIKNDFCGYDFKCTVIPWLSIELSLYVYCIPHEFVQ